MVGDRKHDIVGARSNSVQSLGVLWGYGTREELEAAGASEIIAQSSTLAPAALAQANGNFLQAQGLVVLLDEAVDGSLQINDGVKDTVFQPSSG
jgi:hypothetical protein